MTTLNGHLKLRNDISEIIRSIRPLDQEENDHITDVLAWIDSGDELFRLKKPDTPPKHLVSYFVLYDDAVGEILLVDHIKARLWLPTGGHVEPGEHPQEAVKREVFEELGIQAHFVQENPLFITVTDTVGLTAGHTDVSLWYVLKGNINDKMLPDTEEFHSIKWFKLDEVPFNKSDIHMRRFVSKLTCI